MLRQWPDAGRDLSDLDSGTRRRFRLISFMIALVGVMCVVLTIWLVLLQAWYFAAAIVWLAAGAMVARQCQRAAPLTWGPDAGALALTTTIGLSVVVMIGYTHALNSAAAIWLGVATIMAWAVLRPPLARIMTALLIAACVFPTLFFPEELLVHEPKPYWDILADVVIGSLVMVSFIELAVMSQQHADAEVARTVAKLQEEIARRKQAEQEAQEAERIQSTFLATMSHEVRTPMNGVLGMADILARSELNPSQREMLEVIRSSGDLLSRVLNDTLDVSRLEAGGMALQLGATDVRRTLQQAVSLMDGHVDHVPLQLHVASDIPEFLTIDAARLQQMICNLISNALRFTKSGRIDIRATRTAHGLRVEVEDTGPGIPPSDQERMFRPFAQLDDGHDRTHGGTGLGLSIVRGLAEAMGGEAHLTSTVGQGTTVWFEVPAATASGPEVTQHRERDVSLAKPRQVLLAEDNAVNARILCHMLQRLGLEVTHVENGKLAVDHASNKTFDLIVMDCQMPVMDGYTATRRLREQGTTTPIVACTANAMPEDRARCLRDGMDGYVTKPVSMESLGKAIDAAVAHQALKNEKSLHMPAYA